MAAEQEEIKLVLEAIAKGLGDISTLANAIRKSGEEADKSNKKLTDYEKAVKALEDKIGSLKVKVVELASALLSVETVRFITDQIKAAAETKRVAESLGLSIETLSSYQAILGRFKIDQGETNEALATFTEKLYEAAESGADAQELFGALGITVTDNAGKLKSSEQVLLELADAFQKPGNESVKVATSIGIFGDALGLKMIPALSKGSAGLQEMAAAAKANGEVLGQDQADAAQKAAAALGKMGAELFSLGREMAITFAPAVESGVAITRDLIAVTEFLGKSLGNLAASVLNLDFSNYQKNQKELFDELTNTIAASHSEIGKAAAAIEDAGKKAGIAGKETAELGWNMTIAGRAASDLSGTLSEILQKPLDTNSVTQLALSLEVAGAQAGNTAAIIGDTLTAALAKLSGDQLAKFRDSSEQAFTAGRISAEQYQAILNGISQGALKQLGVDLERLKTGMTDAETDALALFSTVTESADQSSAAIQAGLLQTLQSIETPAGLASLTNQFRTLADQGRLTGDQLAALSPIFNSVDSAIAGGLEPGAEFESLLARLKTAGAQTADGIGVLDQAFKTLGQTAPGALEDTAAAAREAFAAIASGDATIQQQQAAFLSYAESALKAAEAAGQPAPKLLEQQAAALGLSTAYQELQRQVQATAPEFDAITAAMDRQAEQSAAQQETLSIAAAAQANLTEAIAETAIAMGEETQAAGAAVKAADARVAAAQAEAQAQQQAADAARQKLDALEAELATGARLSAEQTRQLSLLRAEVAQKEIAASAAGKLAAAVKTETEATSRFSDALDAALSAIRAALDPQLQLADAKVKAAEAALKAAEAGKDEIAITRAMGDLHDAQIQQAKVLLAVRQGEAAAAREAADAAALQAAADGKLTAAEQESISSAEKLVAAKVALAEAAASTAEATEKQTAATDRATTQTATQARVITQVVDARQQESRAIQQQAENYDALTEAAQRAYQARIRALSAIEDPYRQATAIAAYVRAVDASTQAELNWAAATQRTIENLRAIGLGSATAQQQIQMLGLQATRMGDLMTEAGQSAVDALRDIQREAADALFAIREFIADANEDLVALEKLQHERNLARIREYAEASADARALLDEAEAAEAERHRRELDRIREEMAARREAREESAAPTQPIGGGQEQTPITPSRRVVVEIRQPQETRQIVTDEEGAVSLEAILKQLANDRLRA